MADRLGRLRSEVAQLLGLAANESVIGFVHIGTPQTRFPIAIALRRRSVQRVEGLNRVPAPAIPPLI
jgi:hypothetical protein